jgi:hypothetical protein
MINFKILSRKLILTIGLAVLASLLIFVKSNVTGKPFILDYQWQAVIMATVITYIVGCNIQNNNMPSSVDIKTFWERIKDLFRWDFVLAVLTIIFTTFLLVRGHVENTVWFSIISAIGGAYNIMNPIGKK